jgi:hypothetical protein
MGIARQIGLVLTGALAGLAIGIGTERVAEGARDPSLDVLRAMIVCRHRFYNPSLDSNDLASKVLSRHSCEERALEKRDDLPKEAFPEEVLLPPPRYE